MRTAAFTAILLSCLTLGYAIEFPNLLPWASAPTPAGGAIPGSTPDTHVPAATQVLEGSMVEALKPRQAPANPLLPAAVPNPAAPKANANANAHPAVPPAVPNAPGAPPANAPGVAPLVPPAVAPAVPPAVAPVTTVSTPTPSSSMRITVQWLETWIGGTSRTWMPHTITLRDHALDAVPPAPGKGEIGMGTLTGRIGVTKTVVVGAAKTVGPGWKVGAVAAMGIAGLV